MIYNKLCWISETENAIYFDKSYIQDIGFNFIRIKYKTNQNNYYKKIIDIRKIRKFEYTNPLNNNIFKIYYFNLFFPKSFFEVEFFKNKNQIIFKNFIISNTKINLELRKSLIQIEKVNSRTITGYIIFEKNLNLSNIYMSLNGQSYSPAELYILHDRNDILKKNNLKLSFYCKQFNIDINENFSKKNKKIKIDLNSKHNNLSLNYFSKSFETESWTKLINKNFLLIKFLNLTRNKILNNLLKIENFFFRKRGVDIIMPIYDGVSQTYEAIESVVNSSIKTYKNKNNILYLGMDNPKNIQMRNMIYRNFSDHPRIRIFINKKNLGFVLNTNKLFKKSRKNFDKLIINSDVKVPINYWLNNLKNLSDNDEQIGTITPISNSATIFSFPVPNVSQEYNFQYSIEDLNKLIGVVKHKKIYDVPSCHGFCFFIANSKLRFKKIFNPDFGLGYGEENELSMKILKRGFRNVLYPNTFIYHKESVSFKNIPKVDEYKIRNMEYLNKIYPNYNKSVSLFIEEDISNKFRKIFLIKIIKDTLISNKKCILHISHLRGGGTNKYVEDYASENKKFLHFLLTPGDSNGNFNILFFDKNKFSKTNCYLTLDEDFLKDFKFLIESFKVSQIYLHSLVDFSWRFRINFLKYLENYKIDLLIMIHDYEWVCSQINLMNTYNKSCQLSINSFTCNKCFIDNEMKKDNFLFTLSIDNHREFSQKLFRRAKNIFAPSENTAENLVKLYPSQVFNIKYHDITHKKLEKFSPEIKKYDFINILVLGAIGNNKGFYQLRNFIYYCYSNKIPIYTTVLGYTMNDQDFAIFEKYIEITGKYDEKELDSILEKKDFNASLFLSPWPETFSYTLSHCFRNKIYPITTPNSGAIEERIKKSNYGKVLNDDFPETIVNELKELFIKK